MVPNYKLSKEGFDFLLDATSYKSIVGALQYATITCPKINYALNKATQFMAQPLESHWTNVKGIPLYVKGTLLHVLHLTLYDLCLSYSLTSFL